MDCRKHIVATSTLIIVCASTVFAQKAEVIGGKYTFYVEENAAITFAEARIKALENARTESLKENFGTLISSDIISEMTTDSEGNVRTELREISQETARGEWLGDISDPVLNIHYDKDMHSFAYDVEISGKARKINKSKISIDWKVLCDGVEDKDEKDIFKNGDHLYISFRSPIAGYIAIYLLGDDGTASCLLPYSCNPEGMCTVSAGTKYVYFDKDRDPSAFRYRLKTSRKTENNVVYLIFSPNPFVKCNDEKSDSLHPNSLSVANFEKWRIESMQQDDRMVAEKKWVKIIND